VLTAEVEEIAITLDRSLKQRVAARFTATKKTGKPYMAKIGPGFSREFAKGRKFTNTQKSFYFDDLQIGDVLEFRGYAWQGDAYEGGTDYAVIGQGVIFFVSRTTAKIVIDGGNAFAVDRATPMLRLSPDAQAPSDLQTYSGREFAAWLVDESGEPINVRWPEGQEAE